LALGLGPNGVDKLLASLSQDNWARESKLYSLDSEVLLRRCVGRIWGWRVVFGNWKRRKQKGREGREIEFPFCWSFVETV
jgi:hypothetical protein